MLDDTAQYQPQWMADAADTYKTGCCSTMRTPFLQVRSGLLVGYQKSAWPVSCNNDESQL